MNNYSSRLAHAMSLASISRTQLAQKMGLSYNAVKKVLDGNSHAFSAENNAIAAAVLSVRSDWLARGDGPIKPLEVVQTTRTTSDGQTVDMLHYQGEPVASIGDDDRLPSEYIQIRESEVRFAAGSGRMPVFDEIADSVPRTYRRSWFVQEGINPVQARCFKVHGDSMEPLLFDGDTVLVNLAENTVQNGKVYALRYGDDLRVKRVYRKIDGSLILHSDNPSYLPRDEEISADSAAEHINIIGRVRDKSGTGGL